MSHYSCNFPAGVKIPPSETKRCCTVCFDRHSEADLAYRRLIERNEARHGVVTCEFETDNPAEFENHMKRVHRTPSIKMPDVKPRKLRVPQPVSEKRALDEFERIDHEFIVEYKEGTQWKKGQIWGNKGATMWLIPIPRDTEYELISVRRNTWGQYEAHGAFMPRKDIA